MENKNKNENKAKYPIDTIKHQKFLSSNPNKKIKLKTHII